MIVMCDNTDKILPLIRRGRGPATEALERASKRRRVEKSSASTKSSCSATSSFPLTDLFDSVEVDELSSSFTSFPTIAWDWDDGDEDSTATGEQTKAYENLRKSLAQDLGKKTRKRGASMSRSKSINESLFSLWMTAEDDDESQHHDRQ